MLPQCPVLLRGLSKSPATHLILGPGARKLHLGVGLVAEVSQYIAARCHRRDVCLRSLQAPRMLVFSDAVRNGPRLESIHYVVWQCRSVSMLHLHRR